MLRIAGRQTIVAGVLFSCAMGQPPDPGSAPLVPLDRLTTEQALIGVIERLGTQRTHGLPIEMEIEVYGGEKKYLVEAIDELLKRYPETGFRERALVIQLQTLADLSRVSEPYLDRLLATTARIAEGKPGGALAAANAFYAIQAFVQGARREGMDEQHLRTGAFERYAAFLNDYPDSELVPVIWASYIRTAIQLRKMERAKEEARKFRTRFPNHVAYRRAAGEINRVDAVGRGFAFEFRSADGTLFRSADYKGKVLIVHFWASWSQPSINQVPLLAELDRRYGADGLKIVGISVDRSEDLMKHALRLYRIDWPQYFDGKGLRNDLLVDSGVTEIPTIFIIDAEGTLVNDDPGDKLEAIVTRLLPAQEKTAPAPDGENPPEGGE